MQRLTEGKDFHVQQIAARPGKEPTVGHAHAINHLRVSKQTFMEIKFRIQQELGIDLGTGTIIDLPHVTLESEAV